MPDAPPCPPLSSTIEDLLADLMPIVVGGVLVWFGYFLQHRWTTRKEDRRREADERASRVQYERDVIADLLAALLGWASMVANLRLAYSQARSGATLDRNRVQKYQEDGETFGAALARARVSIRNPAARPALDKLHYQHVKVTNSLTLEALGRQSPSGDTFKDFLSAIGEARLALEEAALNWDGSLQQAKRGSKKASEQAPTTEGSSD